MKRKLIILALLVLAVAATVLLWPPREVYAEAAFRWYYQDGRGYVIALQKDELTPENVNDSGLISSETGQRTYTPLQYCISEGDEEGVKQCLALGADAEKRVETMAVELCPGTEQGYRAVEGYTPLHLAVFLKRYRIVELLLEAGADIESRIVMEGRTPLMEAACNGDVEMMRLLLRRGADAQAVTDSKWCLEVIYQGKTALDYARKGGHAACVELLEAQVKR